MTNVSQREAGSRKGAAVLKAKAKKFAESVRPLLEEDDLAGLSAHATARELNRRGVPTASGWSLDRKLSAEAEGPVAEPRSRGPSEGGRPNRTPALVIPPRLDAYAAADILGDSQASLGRFRRTQRLPVARFVRQYAPCAGRVPRGGVTPG
jgi:hypothetical protein